MTDFVVNDNIIINLDSHEIDNNEDYIKLSQESDIKFEKITSIKALESQHVFDLAIKNTRNFIANDIVAHNTFLNGNNVSDTYVPYTGAIKNVDLGNNNFTVNGTTLFVDSSTGRLCFDIK